METKDINSALNTLNESARVSSDKIRHILEEDYGRIKKVLAEASPEAKSALKDLRKSAGAEFTEAAAKAKKEIEEKAHQLDENIHRNPYLFLGGVGLIAGLVGYIWGRKS